MKKTIVVTPERIETYTEVINVPTEVTKTRIIPAVTKEADVGPGYAEVYRWGKDGAWLLNRPTIYATLKEAADSLRTLSLVPRADYSRARGLAMYVPTDVTAAEALAALNKLDPESK